MSAKTLIIVPAYNEAGNIKKTVQEISSVPFPVDVLVVDDGSTDDTFREALSAGAFAASLPFNLGVGGAVQTGLRFAMERGYHYAVQVDGDGQHDVSFLKLLMEPVLAGQADIAIGSRFTGPFVGYRSSFIRRIGINFFARLISFLIQYKITDPTSGFRAFNRRTIDIFAADYPYDYPEPEAIVLARRSGLRVVEVPVQMRKRASGHSSIRYFRTLYYMIKVTFAILLDMIKPKKGSAYGKY